METIVEHQSVAFPSRNHRRKGYFHSACHHRHLFRRTNFLSHSRISNNTKRYPLIKVISSLTLRFVAPRCGLIIPLPKFIVFHFIQLRNFNNAKHNLHSLPFESCKMVQLNKLLIRGILTTSLTVIDFLSTHSGEIIPTSNHLFKP